MNEVDDVGQTNAVARKVQLEEFDSEPVAGRPILQNDLSLIGQIKVRVEVVAGESDMTIAQLFALKNGEVIQLDTERNAPMVVRMDGKAIAEGHLVLVDGNLGLRISSINR